MAITTILGTDLPSDSRTVINDNFTDLDTTKADLASPTFTGTPTAPTQTAGDNSTALATTAYVDSVALSSFETTTGVTHSLTTTAGQVVAVWAKGDLDPGSGSYTITLKYNSVTKDTVSLDSGGDSWYNKQPFALMYTETPGAATQNITVETSGGTLANVVIMVQIIG